MEAKSTSELLLFLKERILCLDEFDFFIIKRFYYPVHRLIFLLSCILKVYSLKCENGIL